MKIKNSKKFSKNKTDFNEKIFKSGFTIVEVLIFIFIFTVSALSLYQAFNVGLSYSIESKKKLGAVGIANEEIEKYRNLGYENLSAGATENIEIVKNDVTYYVTTNIRSIDDENDGTPDTVSWDYFQVSLDVYWVLNDPDKKITMSAIVVPPVREEDADKGYMRLHVIDQQGSGLSNASVNITYISNNSLVYSGNVNSSGDLFLTGLSTGLHKISIGDSNNYYPVETMGETSSFDPMDGHVDIQSKTLSEKTIQTDVVSTLNVSLKDTFGNTINNLGFDIEGGKLLGVENGTDNIYDFSDSISGSDGTESFSDMSFGPYYLTFTDLNDGTTDYNFLWMNLASDVENKIFLDANDTLEAQAVLASESVPSLLVTVLDNADDKPISGAKVHLQFSGIPSYDVELNANEFGKVYFPETSGQIINEDYDMTVTADGYDQENKAVTINGFTEEIIKLSY